jgi:hypothetical protein
VKVVRDALAVIRFALFVRATAYGGVHVDHGCDRLARAHLDQASNPITSTVFVIHIRIRQINCMHQICA